MPFHLRQLATLLVGILALTGLSPSLAQTSNPAQSGLSISLEIGASAAATRSRPPFVAIWLETPDGEAVTTIETWYNRSRWLPELSQWWRKLGMLGPAQYDAVTGATRRAGSYQIEWDGLTVSGEAVPVGEYDLWVEAAREHGGHDRVRIRVDFRQPGSRASGQGQAELGQIETVVH